MIAAMGYYQWQCDGDQGGMDWDVFSRYPFENFLARDLTLS
jgi:hypothetical protein